MPAFPTRRARPVVLALVLAAGAAAGCASTQAAGTVPAGPPLVVPEPPPRAMTAPAADLAEAPEPEVVVVDPAVVPEAEPADAPAQPAPRPAPEPPAAAAVPPVVEPPPVRNLQTSGGAGEDAAVAAIRTQLRRAARDLDQVDYRALSGAGRLQYEQSRRFSQQAEAALRDRNLTFAATLAEKAAALAAGLAGA